MVLMENGCLLKVESIAECSKGSILQYFWPALSDNRYWMPILVFFFSGHLEQVLQYNLFPWTPPWTWENTHYFYVNMLTSISPEFPISLQKV